MDKCLFNKVLGFICKNMSDWYDDYDTMCNAKRKQLCSSTTMFDLCFKSCEGDELTDATLLGVLAWREEDATDSTRKKTHPSFFPVLYVYELQVTSEYRKCGVGGQFMDRAIRRAATLSVPVLMLTVNTKNKTAYDFYVNRGFVPHRALTEDVGEEDQMVCPPSFSTLPSSPCRPPAAQSSQTTTNILGPAENTCTFETHVRSQLGS